MANTLWQVIAAYIFAVFGGSISASLRLEHKPLCALISFAAGTLLGVTIFAILPESFGACPWWAVLLALITGYALFFFISKHVHHVCPACAASHFDADATRHFSEIANALIVALAIHSTTDGLALGIQGEASATGAIRVVVVLCFVHPQGSRRSRARQSFDRRRTATRGRGWMGGSGRSHNAPRRCHRLFLPERTSPSCGSGLIMAHVGGGFIYLATHAVVGEMLKHGKKLVLTSFALGVALIAVLNVGLRLLR